MSVSTRFEPLRSYLTTRRQRFVLRDGCYCVSCYAHVPCNCAGECRHCEMRLQSRASEQQLLTAEEIEQQRQLLMAPVVRVETLCDRWTGTEDRP